MKRILKKIGNFILYKFLEFICYLIDKTFVGKILDKFLDWIENRPKLGIHFIRAIFLFARVANWIISSLYGRNMIKEFIYDNISGANGLSKLTSKEIDELIFWLPTYKNYINSLLMLK